MNEIIELFYKIQRTSSTKDKIRLLSENSENERFKKWLKYLVCGDVVTGISAKKLQKKVSPSTELSPLWIGANSEFDDVIDYLKKNNTGTDDDIYEIQCFLRGHEEDREFYEQMITKKFKLGADVKTINKAIPGLIQTWEVQQAYPISDKNAPKKNEWFMLSRKLNGCFTTKANVIMEDGSKKPISKINVGEKVLSFDPQSNQLCSEVVTKVFHNGIKTDWRKIKIGYSNSHIGSYNVTSTSNHKFFTPNGWVQAEDLAVGDILYVRDYTLSDEQISILVGLGLGDGNVFLNDDGVRFTYCKESKYKNFFNGILSLFQSNAKEDKARSSGYGSEILRMHINTLKSAPAFMNNRDNLLRSGYTFTEEIIEKITPLALAIYYIDDGSKLPSKNDGYMYCKNVRTRSTLATHRHNKKEVERFSKYLAQKYEIENRIVRYKELKLDGDNGYQIEISADGTEKLFNIIAPYVPHELRPQKLGKDWQNVPYIDWTQKFGSYQLVEKRVTEISPMYGKRCAYDLEVNQTHTYFANGFAVHNCNCAYVDGRLVSRQGKDFNGLNHIIKDIEKLPFENMFFNGELVRDNVDDLPDNDNFQVGTGIINSDDADKSCIKFIIYEMFPAEEFYKGLSKLTYKNRRKAYLEPLTEAIKDLRLTSIEVVQPMYEGRDLSAIQRELDRAEANGWEGCMCNKDTKWQAKRNNGILKVKSFKHSDVKCTGVFEGEGKNVGSLGGIYCYYKGFKLGVGSGFTDAQRRKFWNDPDSIIGKIVQIKYKNETQNKNGGISVQFPIFEFIREDKTEESYE